MTAGKFHTVLCERNCSIAHHELLSALLGSDQRGASSLQLTKCVEAYVNNGWAKDSDVPDKSEKLRQPLLFLAAAFGKRKFLEQLLQLGFDVSVRNRDGETVIHGAVRLLYKCYICTYWITKKNLLDALISVVITRNSHLILSKDNQNQTVLHVAARSLSETPPKAFGRWSTEGRVCGKVCYYQDALESMLKKIDNLEKAGSLAREHVMEALNARDCKGDRIFDILRKSCNKQSLDMIGYIANRFSDYHLAFGNVHLVELAVLPRETNQASQVEIVPALNTLLNEVSERNTMTQDSESHLMNSRSLVQDNFSTAIDDGQPPAKFLSKAAETSTCLSPCIEDGGDFSDSMESRQTTNIYREIRDYRLSCEDEFSSSLPCSVNGKVSVEVQSPKGLLYGTSQNSPASNPMTSCRLSLNQQQTQYNSDGETGDLDVGESQYTALNNNRQSIKEKSEESHKLYSVSSTKDVCQSQSCSELEKVSSDPVVIHLNSLAVCYDSNCETSEVAGKSSSCRSIPSYSQSFVASLTENQQVQHSVVNSSEISSPQVKKKQEINLLESEVPLVYSMITEDSSLDSKGKWNVLRVFQQEYQRRMDGVDASIPQLESDIVAFKADIIKKKERVDELQCELAHLESQIKVLSDAVDEKLKKRKALNDEKETLAKRIKHCQEMRNEFGGSNVH